MLGGKTVLIRSVALNSAPQLDSILALGLPLFSYSVQDYSRVSVFEPGASPPLNPSPDTGRFGKQPKKTKKTKRLIDQGRPG